MLRPLANALYLTKSSFLCTMEEGFLYSSYTSTEESIRTSGKRKESTAQDKKRRGLSSWEENLCAVHSTASASARAIPSCSPSRQSRQSRRQMSSSPPRPRKRTAASPSRSPVPTSKRASRSSIRYSPWSRTSRKIPKHGRRTKQRSSPSSTRGRTSPSSPSATPCFTAPTSMSSASWSRRTSRSSPSRAYPPLPRSAAGSIAPSWRGTTSSPSSPRRQTVRSSKKSWRS